MTRTAFACALTLGLLWAVAARADETVEKFAGGNVRLRYSTDAEGRKNGACLEYFENGKLKIKASYLAGELSGTRVEHYESGRVKVKADYKAGQLHGPYADFFDSGKQRTKTAYNLGRLRGPYQEWDEKGRLVKEQAFWDDLLLYPRSTRQMKAALDAIAGQPVAAKPADGSPAPPSLADAKNVAELQRLNAYRYLAGVAHDVKLSAELCAYAQAAADICARIGRLDHSPTNPGMPEDQYKKALHGTMHANLHFGRGQRGCVDGFMFDSDSSNIDAVGHRRWCINPLMMEVGFAENGKFCAMYAHDTSRKDAADFDFVAFPPPGYMPRDYFSPQHAWNVSPSTEKYAKPTRAVVKVSVYPLAATGPGQVPDPTRRGEPLKLNHFSVNSGGYGLRDAVVFRPEALKMDSGARYWVQISGLKRRDGTDARVEYLVEFTDL